VGAVDGAYAQYGPAYLRGVVSPMAGSFRTASPTTARVARARAARATKDTSCATPHCIDHVKGVGPIKKPDHQNYARACHGVMLSHAEHRLSMNYARGRHLQDNADLRARCRRRRRRHQAPSAFRSRCEVEWHGVLIMAADYFAFGMLLTTVALRDGRVELASGLGQDRIDGRRWPRHFDGRRATYSCSVGAMAGTSGFRQERRTVARCATHGLTTGAELPVATLCLRQINIKRPSP
jgi:hypothetical protein